MTNQKDELERVNMRISALTERASDLVKHQKINTYLIIKATHEQEFNTAIYTKEILRKIKTELKQTNYFLSKYLQYKEFLLQFKLIEAEQNICLDYLLENY